MQACVDSVDSAIDCCGRIGYPVMLKASWGGGGKGIRKVHSDDEVRMVFKQIQVRAGDSCCACLLLQLCTMPYSVRARDALYCAVQRAGSSPLCQRHHPAAAWRPPTYWPSSSQFSLSLWPLWTAQIVRHPFRNKCLT